MERVIVGECRCPGAPHTDGDWVEFPPKLSIEMGAEATFAYNQTLRGAVERGADITGAFSAVEGALAAVWLRYIAGWSFLETAEDGQVLPVPVNTENIRRLLPWSDGGAEVIEFADALYSEELTRPLVRRRAELSQAGPSEVSTSPSPSSGATPPTLSEPSSPTDTDGKPSEDPAP